MKIITLHCDYIKFKPLKKALKQPEELSEERKKEIVVNDPLVVLVAVEKADNLDLVKSLIENIEDIAKQINSKKIVLYPYAHLSSNLSSPDLAMNVLENAEKELKKLKYEVVRAPFGYYKEFELKCKGHPLSELSREIGERNINNKTEKIEQNKKIDSGGGKIILDRRGLKPNDHRILGEDLEIFTFADDVGAGLPLWMPNGEIIRNQLISFMREIEEKYGYKYVSTPHITKGHLYERTGHLPYYKDSMYSPIEIDGVDYYLKPMNCPHHHMIYNKLVKSYRDLPLRLAEAGMTYRNELSGVTYGLIRVKGFTQNDAHLYVTPYQLKEEFLKVLKMFNEVYEVMCIKNYWFRLSLPDFKSNPEKYTGEESEWEYACNEIRKTMKEFGKKFIEEKGEAAFYGPKIDVQIKNSQGKEETIATSQVDIVVPKRLNLFYVNDKGEKETPIVIHRAILGSYERFIAYILEQTEGKLPLWLSPIQIRIINFTDRNTKYAEKIINDLKKTVPNIRIDFDFSSVPLSSKIRQAELMKIPYILVIGDKEEKEKKIAVRQRGSNKISSQTIENFIKTINKEIEEKK